MRVSYDESKPLGYQYAVTPKSVGSIAAVDAIRTWNRPEQLADFALTRRGYMDGNGYFGVTYPDEQDEYDRITEPVIPVGSVRVVAGYGDPASASHDISEPVYVELLRQILLLWGHSDLALRLSTPRKEIRR